MPGQDNYSDQHTLVIVARVGSDLRLLCPLGLYRAVKGVSFPESVSRAQGVFQVSVRKLLWSKQGKQTPGMSWPPSLSSEHDNKLMQAGGKTRIIPLRM